MTCGLVKASGIYIVAAHCHDVKLKQTIMIEHESSTPTILTPVHEMCQTPELSRVQEHDKLTL
jgi:hypothetical protein